MRRFALSATTILFTFSIATLNIAGCPGAATSESIGASEVGDSTDTGNVTRDETTRGSDAVDTIDASTSDDTPVATKPSNPGTGTPQDDGTVILPPLTLTLEDGDTSGDGAVNEQDLEVLVDAYGSSDPGVVSKNDLDGDGDVDITDLALLVRILTELT